MADVPAKCARSIWMPEVLAINAIISTTISIQLPNISFAREKSLSKPLPLHFLWCDHPWDFVVCIPLITTCGLLGIWAINRRLFPHITQKRFVWSFRPVETKLVSRQVASARPAVFALLLALLATSLLLVVASHAGLDRSQKPPVLKWEGPMVRYVHEAAVAGYAITGVTILVGVYALIHSSRLLNVLAVFALTLACNNLLATWIFYAIDS